MTITEMIKAIELERFHMGLGAVEFAKHIGIHYHTYNDFRRQRKMPYAPTMSKILEFMKSIGKEITELDMK